MPWRANRLFAQPTWVAPDPRLIIACLGSIQVPKSVNQVPAIGNHVDSNLHVELSAPPPLWGSPFRGGVAAAGGYLSRGPQQRVERRDRLRQGTGGEATFV